MQNREVKIHMARPRSGPAGVLLFMADNRPLFSPTHNASPSAVAELTFEQMVATLNAEYARSFGYDFVYAELQAESVWARLPDGRELSRHVAWARLLLVAELTRIYEPRRWLLYLDSDNALAREPPISFDDYLSSTRLLAVFDPSDMCSPLVGTLDEERAQRMKRRDASLLLVSNAPWTRQPPEYALACTGFHAWRAPLDWALLGAWWAVDTHAELHTWEQRALNDVLYPEHHAKSTWRRMTCLAPIEPARARHVASDGYCRLPQASSAL